MTDSETMEVLKFLVKHDMADRVFYHNTEVGIEISVNCNDLFWWGTSDGEDLTPERLPILEQAITDIDKAYKDGYGYIYADTLFACRIRGLRPQGACYVSYPKAIWPLLDDAGPKRPIDMGNPLTPEQGVERSEHRKAKAAKGFLRRLFGR